MACCNGNCNQGRDCPARKANMKPEFLTSPAAWTRAPRTSQSAVDAACAIQRQRETGYPLAWWVAMILICVATAVVVML